MTKSRLCAFLLACLAIANAGVSFAESKTPAVAPAQQQAVNLAPGQTPQSQVNQTTAATSTSTVQPYTGQVQMSQQQPAQTDASSQPMQQVTTTTVVQQTTTVQPALTAADYVGIDFKPVSAKHKLQQVSLTLQNKQPKHIELLQMEVMNGMDETAYMQLNQERSGAKRRLAGGILSGITSVASSFVPYAGLGSMAAYQSIYAGQAAVNATANAMANQPVNTADYTNRITQRVNNVLVSPNQNFQCLAVIPENQPPVVKVIFKDLQTNQIFELQK